MQKLLLTTAALAVVLCFVNDVSAFEVKNRFMVSGHGGLAIPVGDFGDGETSNLDAGAATLGLSLGVSLEYGISEQILIGGRFAFNRFGIDEDFLRDELSHVESVEGHWTVIEVFGLYGKYLVPTHTSTRPYGRAGLFLGKPEITVDASEEGWSRDYDLSLGFEVALGVTHMVSPELGIGLEARFAHLRESESGIERTDGASRQSASAYGPNGVRDPGGNIDWLAASGFLTYGF